mgnify:CR=1 FL=1
MSQLSLDPSLDSDTLRGTLPTCVHVYTDGGCDPNPGPGGWGAIIRWQDQEPVREWVLSGNDPNTTNNRMELCAAAAALALLEGLLGRCQVYLYTDSEYLRRGITEWIEEWVSRDWRTSGKQPVKNQDLWRVIHRLVQAHDVTWHWIKGHAGHPLNERADQLATAALRTVQCSLSSPAAAPPAVDDGRPAVEIYVKASSRGSAGRGGWGAVLRMDEHTRSLSESEQSATANSMLIRGATAALHALTRPCRVTLYSDANYLIQGASTWVKNWQAHGWTTRDGKSVANRAEWEALLEAASRHHVTWIQIRGDDVPADLEWAGELAAQAARPDETDPES